MKAVYFLILSVLLLTGCSRNRDEFWDDTKTAGHHMGRGFRTMGGKHGDSRAVHCSEEFERHYAYDQDFVPLADSEDLNHISMTAQPAESPGEYGSSIPGIEAFKDPNKMSGMATIFKNVHFPLDSPLIKGTENWDVIRQIASYMKQHRGMYLFVEGHCDERGAEAYNLALGARRSNSVRDALIKEGTNPNHIFTISYGKERPLVTGHNESSWAKNRRAQFKVYEKQG